MARKLICIVMFVGLLWAGTSYAGNMCWTDGWGNYWKLYVTKPDGVSPYKTVTGAWYLPANFLIPVTGTLQKDLGGTALRLSVTGSYLREDDTIEFYLLDATIDPTTKNGTIRYLDKSYTSSDQGSETFTKTPCSELPAY